MKDHFIYVKIRKVYYTDQKYLRAVALSQWKTGMTQQQQWAEKPGKFILKSKQLNCKNFHVSSEIIFKMITHDRLGGWEEEQQLG